MDEDACPIDDESVSEKSISICSNCSGEVSEESTSEKAILSDSMPADSFSKLVTAFRANSLLLESLQALLGSERLPPGNVLS